MVQVNWTLEAQQDVSLIFQYWVQFSYQYAQDLMEQFFSSTDLLETTPQIGSIETLFEDYEHEYRYLVINKRYKIVYLYQNNICDILLVWDCYRNPQLLKSRLKNG
ncbi:MAG: type II toxin-antitoxin system RelE/ParE family toxin [Paludibacteraceae bacterium]|nr:type II toxin-antitoxin system RelE/ParE family toxin [Paludibacteraceae bacterium]